MFSLGGWSPRLPTKFLVLRGTLDPCPLVLPFTYAALTLSGLPFQVIRLGLTSILPVLNPEKPELLGLALPSSLAATVGISFDFSSSGYLDVSVPQVPSLAGDHP